MSITNSIYSSNFSGYLSSSISTELRIDKMTGIGTASGKDSALLINDHGGGGEINTKQHRVSPLLRLVCSSDKLFKESWSQILLEKTQLTRE